tara:strand:+ start:1345 stop:1626 length:282 start_codon:yes stop_codon:yes gene_type:complete
LELNKQDADNHILTSPIAWGKYGIVQFYMEGGKPSKTVFQAQSCGYLYSHVWSARAFGIVNKGNKEPTKHNHYTHSAVINMETGEIEWRNYES